MNRQRGKKYLLLLHIGKHSGYRLEKMARALNVDQETLKSFLFHRIVIVLKERSDMLPWVSKLSLEIGETEVKPTHAAFWQGDYFAVLGLASSQGLTMEVFASRLLAAFLPFWDFRPAIGLAGLAQREALRKGIRIDLALMFAKL
jgi:hypothetical protein